MLVATAANRTQWTYTTTNRSFVFNVLAHPVWRLRLTAYDNAGNASAAVATIYDDTAAFGWGSRWKHVSSATAFRRGFERARTVGAWAGHKNLVGQRFVLYVEMCRSCGRIGVYDGHGRHLMTIETYSSWTRYRVPVTILTLPRAAARTFVVRVMPGKNAHSTGHDVDIDALAVS